MRRREEWSHQTLWSKDTGPAHAVGPSPGGTLPGWRHLVENIYKVSGTGLEITEQAALTALIWFQFLVKKAPAIPMRIELITDYWTPITLMRMEETAPTRSLDQ